MLFLFFDLQHHKRRVKAYSRAFNDLENEGGSNRAYGTAVATLGEEAGQFIACFDLGLVFWEERHTGTSISLLFFS